jgi:hypothetical protein
VSKAIPTVYNGVQYRSMLEARWAAFFELAGVDAQYEPEALPGYIPDFYIPAGSIHACEYPCIVEVKGILGGFDLQKIRKAGWGVGDPPSTEPSFYGNVLLATSGGPQELTIYARRYDGLERVHKLSFGLVYCVKCNVRAPQDDTFGPQMALWKEAGNLVQWRSPRGRVA